MAIAKDIAVHGTIGTKNVLAYVSNEEKTSLYNCGYDVDALNESIKSYKESNDKLFTYAENLEKTAFILDGDEEILISGYHCTPETASIEFQLARDKYYQYVGDSDRIHGTKKIQIKNTDGSITTKEVEKQSIETHHIIQSFPEIPGLDPRLIHHLGLELAKRAFPNHKCVIATHMNTNHLHNHIIMCAYNDDSIGKYHSNKSSRKAYRAINDEISLEYGLPILLDNDLSHRSLNWLEWDARNRGESWKDTIRHDIDLLSSLSSSWEDFLQRMRNAGYKIRETDKYVTYTMAGSDTKKVRDKSLGSNYLRETIKSRWPDNDLSLLETSEPEKSFITPSSSTPVALILRVSRYTESGRRRSDLEVILIKAIKLLKYFMDQFFDEEMYIKDSKNPIYLHAETKIHAMEQALYAVRQLGIESKSDLKIALNQTGSELSHFKKELSNLEESIEFYTQIAEKIAIIRQIKPEIERIVNISSYQLDVLYLSNYTDEQISFNIAEAIPMSSKQRQELFIKLQDSSWHINCSFKQISYMQAKEILDFLNSKSSYKPSILLDDEEYLAYKTSNKYKSIAVRFNQALKEKYEDIPITSHLVNILTRLLIDKEINLSTDISSLNSFQALELINHLSGNMFAGNLIREDKCNDIRRLLNDKHLKTNRPLEYVMESEADKLMEYLLTGKGQKPDLLRDSRPASQSELLQINELLLLKGEKCMIPLQYLTALDIQKLQAYLLNKDIVPDILKANIEKSNDEAFIKSLSNINYHDRAVLTRYRNLLNDLRSYGIESKNLEELSKELAAQQSQYTSISQQVDELKARYRDLSKLEYSLNLAQTAAFTHGPLHHSLDTISIDSSTQEQDNKRTVKEDDLIYNQTRKNKDLSSRSNKLFSGIDDSFFDRM